MNNICQLIICRKYRNRRAVILIFVLLLLSVCGSIFGQYVTKILRLSMNAVNAEKEMQQRWAIISLRRSVLDDAATLLSLASRGDVDEEQASVSVIRLSVRLNNHDYLLQLEDESAKLPLQRLLAEKEQEAVRPIIRELAPISGSLQQSIPRDASSWKQIFVMPKQLTPRLSLAWMQSQESLMTLHSDGRLNIKVCSDAVLNALWRFKFGVDASKELHEARRRSTLQDIRSISASCSLGVLESDFAEKWCSTFSNAYSLWIDGANREGNGFTAVYFRLNSPGFAEEQFGFHSP